MKLPKTLWYGLFAVFACIVITHSPAAADDDTTSLVEFFKQGTFNGQLKTYYYSQYFDGDGLNDSKIWVNGGNLGYKTAKLYGFRLGATFQASFVGHKDDDDGRTAGTMDANGAVLSEAYVSYKYSNTRFIGFRQYMKFPLVTGSSSRMIKESFESYLLSNEDIPDTKFTVGLVTKYQTRTDKTFSADNWFVDFETNGTGDVGDFYDIGDDGMLILHLQNNSIKNLDFQAMYGDVFDEVASFYADAKYTFDKTKFTPYLAVQFYFTDYDDSEKDSNELFGIKGGATFYDVDIFAAYTTAGGDEGDERVFRGVGQGAYYQYTATTKTSGKPAFEAGTDAFQIGAAYTYKGLAGMLRYTVFDDPAPNADLDEYTLNVTYKFGGWAENLSLGIDFSILDYENDQKDQTDLRTRLIYSF